MIEIPVDPVSPKTDAVTEDGDAPGTDIIDVSSNYRRTMCGLLESLANDMCASRCRQNAAALLDFMESTGFGRPDGAIRSDASRPSESPPFDRKIVTEMEALVAAGLESIVRGQMPADPTAFVIAAYALLEAERAYGPRASDRYRRASPGSGLGPAAISRERKML
jgi:hypothetical protein